MSLWVRYRVINETWTRNENEEKNVDDGTIITLIFGCRVGEFKRKYLGANLLFSLHPSFFSFLFPLLIHSFPSILHPSPISLIFPYFLISLLSPLLTSQFSVFSLLSIFLFLLAFRSSHHCSLPFSPFTSLTTLLSFHFSLLSSLLIFFSTSQTTQLKNKTVENALSFSNWILKFPI